MAAATGDPQRLQLARLDPSGNGLLADPEAAGGLLNSDPACGRIGADQSLARVLIEHDSPRGTGHELFASKQPLAQPRVNGLVRHAELGRRLLRREAPFASRAASASRNLVLAANRLYIRLNAAASAGLSASMARAVSPGSRERTSALPSRNGNAATLSG